MLLRTVMRLTLNLEANSCSEGSLSPRLMTPWVISPRNVSLIQVLDRAVVPEVKSAPFRTGITLIGAFLGFFSAVAFLLTREVWRAKQEDPAIGTRVQIIRSAQFR